VMTTTSGYLDPAPQHRAHEILLAALRIEGQRRVGEAEVVRLENRSTVTALHHPTFRGGWRWIVTRCTSPLYLRSGAGDCPSVA